MYSYTNCNPVIQLTSAKLLIQNQTCEINRITTKITSGNIHTGKNNNKLKTGANEDANSETFKKKTEKKKKGQFNKGAKK